MCSLEQQTSECSFSTRLVIAAPGKATGPKTDSACFRPGVFVMAYYSDSKTSFCLYPERFAFLIVGGQRRLPPFSFVFPTTGGRSYPAGSWSDDTAMNVAAIDAVVKDEGRIDYSHIMQNFLTWWSGRQHFPLYPGFPYLCIMKKEIRPLKNG